MFLPWVLFDRSEKTIVFDFFDFLTLIINNLTLIINKIELVMIKKFFMLAVAALALVACGDDNEPDTPAIEKSKCEVTHTVNVAQDLLEVANVTIYYIGANGLVVSEPINSATWTKTVTQALPCKFGVALSCTMKQGVQLDENRTYSFSGNAQLSANIVAQNGKFTDTYNKTSTLKKAELNADGVAAYISTATIKVERAVDEMGETGTSTIDWGFNAGEGATTDTPVSGDPATGDAE